MLTGKEMSGESESDIPGGEGKADYSRWLHFPVVSTKGMQRAARPDN